MEYKERGNVPHRVVPTSEITFVETEHGRLRRKQRGIDKKDLQAAIKYGKRQGTQPRPNGDRTGKYTYKEITYIVNEVSGEEVTCYSKPLELDCVPINNRMVKEHNQAKQRIQSDLNCWTSNTVVVVDTSGSMKAADMWRTRNRLGAVWVSVALDYLAHRLESGAASPTDVLSIVTLEENPRAIVHEQPCTWVLYNRLVRIYSQNEVPPQGHGPFLPSLEVAEKLLTRNPNAACAVALMFLSDGVPSDWATGKHCTKEEWRSKIVERVGNLAKKFGRRLTFAAIGIGADSSHFHVLERMVEEAKDYMTTGIFALPSMTSASLGDVFSSVASSVTTTQTEMTDVTTLKQRQVRDVRRESRRKASQQIDIVSTEDFWIYKAEKVVRTVYKEWHEGRQKKQSFDRISLQHPKAEYVAFSKEAFGEGAERFAYRFYELASDARTIVGKAMVAKESRLILDEGGAGDGGERARKTFVRTFCSTQQLARRLAEEFNKKLNETRRVDPRTPRISFLDCSVYQLNDVNLGRLSVLVEEKLDHTKWHKWNANNGFVEGMKKAPEFDHATLREAFTKVDTEDLGIIEEDSEDESDDEEDEGSSVYDHARVQPKEFSPSEVAQAFSHFTYWATGRKRLVCDLQGVYDDEKKLLKFSDPVIHYHHSGRLERRFVHGQTDRGRKGMAMFFETHKEHCGHLCRLMLRGFRHHPRQQQHHHGSRQSQAHKN